ncbi:transposase [Pochonia chlamydosporia 170]|uniref:Transposase n=1 Tax=Pochonia chlamydosporia 170 TaxID=1380566 RepID=A0A179EW62_METCM|nr:transposase [Pochonia chlamydosporia 170]OAQ57412.1 transposase [Pochonia chlamydosporia 170]
MPSSRPRRKYTEDDMAEAILDITDNGFSPSQAAQRWGVPRTTLIDRLNGQTAVSLGYVPSHNQIRACVMGLLGQQGEQPELGRNWVARFIERRRDLRTKIGRRQEANRFDSFTPKAVHWYFDIREGQYGWIRPENTVNVDEGGLDSLVVGSADPKRKALLKGSQTRNWTSFIEAITADGRALTPGIIFKGKELQKQWFVNEFKKIADWHYITSPNGWTDDHIAVERLKRVYLPQTKPTDESDARLIILDGHGSHATVFSLPTPANGRCEPSRGRVDGYPLDNGVFNASKAAYRRELEKLTSLTDSAPMDKVNFIRAYAKAREVGMTKKNILSGWRVAGNWPISRAKALRHPEIQEDRQNDSPKRTPEPAPYFGSDDTPKTSRQIRDLGLNKTPKTRRRYNVIAKGFESQQQTLIAHAMRIAGLEEELVRLKRGKKRRSIPNPNKVFMTLGEALASGEAITEKESEKKHAVVNYGPSGESGSESAAGSVIVVREETILPQRITRSGSLPKRPKN